jgi:hypothetical protein
VLLCKNNRIISDDPALNYCLNMDKMLITTAITAGIIAIKNFAKPSDNLPLLEVCDSGIHV